MDKARTCLADAVKIQALSPRVAGREAYLACFHAAQAAILARTGRQPRTHRGVRAEFLRLAHAGALPEPDLRTFFADAYALKALADYETAPDQQISAAEAARAVEGASRFVAAVALLIDGPATSGR